MHILKHRKKPAKIQKKLTMWGFFSITLSMVLDIYEYPIFASSGLQLIFFLLIGGFLWFIPVALCSAEMATIKNAEVSGIFYWVKNSLGERLGFAAIFYQWFQITVGFISMLYFIFSALLYIFGVDGAVSPWMKFVAVVFIYWLLTLIQSRGEKIMEGFGKIGVTLGIVVPAVVMLTLAIIYLVDGNPVQINLSPATIVPNFENVSTLVIFTSFLLSFMGVEASSSYINDLDNPKKNYPVAIFLVVIVAIILNAIGGLSIAISVPADTLSLSGGILQSIATMLNLIYPNLMILVKITAALIMLGVLAEISGWIASPARGLLEAISELPFPKILRKTSKNGFPTTIVIIQGVVVTIWALILTVFAGGNNLAFTLAISITVIIYLAMYIIFFIAYFKQVLKIKKPSAFEMPLSHTIFGLPLKLLVATLGLLTSLFALLISFVPPASITGSDQVVYQVILTTGLLLSLTLPFGLYELVMRHAKHNETMGV